MSDKGIKILAIRRGSPAHRAHLQAGDLLLALNGRPLQDALDLRFYLQSGDAELEFQRAGSIRTARLRLLDGEEVGWELEPLQLRRCHCDCVFCFVHQLPEGLRPSLFIKDEDYRFSFLFGNYLTLVGFTSRDLERVLRLRLSPLYVSIHATDARLRGRLLGLKRASILPMLHKLIGGGIEIHGQIVLVPGWNDGEALEQTLQDLLPLIPGLASLSLVPVGLTQYRRRLAPIRGFQQGEALAVLDIMQKTQEKTIKQHGRRWIYPADELLLQAESSFPAAQYYEEFPQLDNGVGLCRWTIDQAKTARAKCPKTLQAPRRLLWVTGRSAQAVLQSMAASFMRRVSNISIEILTVNNSLLGESVTVAGLLSGGDMQAAIRQWLSEAKGRALDAIYLPPHSGNADGLMLDDLTAEDLERDFGVPVRIFDGNWLGMITGGEKKRKAS